MVTKYSLVENKLTADPNDHWGRGGHNATATMQDVAQKIACPSSTVTAAAGTIGQP